MNGTTDDNHSTPDLHEALRALPLLDELFLAMQAMNVDVVDVHLRELEAELLQEYVRRERTPPSEALFVSALSQMWVFALYELLRTWRQRVREVVKWADDTAGLGEAAREGALAAKRAEIQRRASEAGDAEARWQMFQRAEDSQVEEELRLALNRTELAFRDVEAVRMTLAKHEVPRSRGTYAGAPGYGRIDIETGSISWQVELGNQEVTVISRRDLADSVRALSRPNDRVLPATIQARVAQIERDTERESYGISRVAVVLADGTEHGGVHVAWATEVVRVEGQHGIPFAVREVVEVRPDPRAEAMDDDAPF